MSVKEWKYLFFLSLGIIIIAVIFVGSWAYHDRKEIIKDQSTERNAWDKKKDSLISEVSFHKRNIEMLMKRDSGVVKKIQDINNYYNSNYYGKINDSSFIDFDGLIDSILSRHDRIPFEKNY